MPQTKAPLTSAHGNVRRRLPTRYYTEIGRIITRWAIIEDVLEGLVFHALWISEEQGRLVLRGQRATERLLLLQTLLRFQGIAANIDWGTARNHLDQMETLRDRLAHNIWIRRPDTDVPVMRDLSGAYIKDLPQGHKPKLLPLSVRVPFAFLQNMRRSMDQLIKQLIRFDADVFAALTLQHTRGKLRQPRPSGVRRRKTPKAPLALP